MKINKGLVVKIFLGVVIGLTLLNTLLLAEGDKDKAQIIKVQEENIDDSFDKTLDHGKESGRDIAGENNPHSNATDKLQHWDHKQEELSEGVKVFEEEKGTE